VNQEQNIEINQSNKNSNKILQQPVQKQLPQLPIKTTSEKENILSDSFLKQIPKQLPQIPQQKIEKLKEDNLIETSLYAEQKQQKTKKDSFKEENQIESNINPLTPESPKLLLKPSNKIKLPLPTLESETKTDESNAIKQEAQKPIEEQQNQITKNKSTIPIESIEVNKISSVSILGQVKQTSQNQIIYENLDHSSKLTSELASNLTKKLPQLPKFSDIKDSQTNLENKVNLLEQSIIHQEKSENLSKEKSNSPESPKLFLQPTSKQLPQLPIKTTSEKENILSDSFLKQIPKQLPQIPQQKIEKLKEDNLIETPLYAEQKQQKTKKDSFKEENQIESNIKPLTPESPKLLLKPSNKIKQPLPMLELETKTDESNAIKQEEQKPIEEQQKSSEIMIASTPESPKLLLQSSNRIKKSLPKLDSESEIFLNSSPQPNEKLNQLPSTPKKLPQLPIKDSTSKQLPQLPIKSATNKPSESDYLNETVPLELSNKEIKETRESNNTTEEVTLITQEPDSSQLPFIKKNITQSNLNMSYINKSDDENENSPNLLKHYTQSKTDNKMSIKNSTGTNKIQTVFCPVRPAKKKQLDSEMNLSFNTSQTINQNNDIDSLFLENQKEIDNNNSTIKKQVDRKKSSSNNLYRSESPEDFLMYNSSNETPNKSKSISRLVKDDSTDDLFKSNNSNNVNKVSRLSSIDSTYKQNQSPIQKHSNQDLFQQTFNESPTFQKKLSKFIKNDSNDDLFQASTNSNQLNNSLKDLDSEKQINESNQDLFANNKEIQQLRKNKSNKTDSNDELYNNSQNNQPQTDKINNLYKKNSDPDLSSQSKRSSLKSDNQNSRPESRATNESIKQTTKQENNNNLSRQRWKAAFYKIRLQLRYVSVI
jgi:hypothetical protein